MVSRTTTTYTLVIMAFAQTFMGAAAVSGNAQGLGTSGRQLFSGLALFAGGYEATHPTAEYMSSAPAVYEPTQQATSIGGYHAPKPHPHPHPHPRPHPVPMPAPIHESPKYDAASAPYPHRPEYPITQPEPTYAPASIPLPQYVAAPEPECDTIPIPAPTPAPSHSTRYPAVLYPVSLPTIYSTATATLTVIPMPTTITRSFTDTTSVCMPTTQTDTSLTTIYQSIPTTTTTTDVYIRTSTVTSTVTATTTSTAIVTNVSSITITCPNPPVIIPTTIISTSHYTETLISQIFHTATEQVTDTKTKYATCWDTVVECCPVTVCQHMCDTYYYTCTKTCIDYSMVTVERPCTEYVPSQVYVTNTAYQTITLCQPVTVTTPVTDYDTIFQIVTVNHTATVTKPVLVVQNICTDAYIPPPPPPPPAYGAAPAAAPASFGIISNYQFTPDPYANADNEELDVDATTAPRHIIKKTAKRVSTLNKPKPQIRVKESAHADIVRRKA
ncbi:hypothetical protein GGF37_002063 [Kickxella alabastrina]|nr:hypothetical protein GGF37_002063 [Kickxella alabastrina]